jgi:hypothetical protein
VLLSSFPSLSTPAVHQLTHAASDSDPMPCNASIHASHLTALSYLNSWLSCHAKKYYLSHHGLISPRSSSFHPILTFASSPLSSSLCILYSLSSPFLLPFLSVSYQVIGAASAGWTPLRFNEWFDNDFPDWNEIDTKEEAKAGESLNISRTRTCVWLCVVVVVCGCG